MSWFTRSLPERLRLIGLSVPDLIQLLGVPSDEAQSWHAHDATLPAYVEHAVVAFQRRTHAAITHVTDLLRDGKPIPRFGAADMPPRWWVYVVRSARSVVSHEGSLG